MRHGGAVESAGCGVTDPDLLLAARRVCGVRASVGDGMVAAVSADGTLAAFQDRREFRSIDDPPATTRSAAPTGNCRIRCPVVVDGELLSRRDIPQREKKNAYARGGPCGFFKIEAVKFAVRITTMVQVPKRRSRFQHITIPHVHAIVRTIAVTMNELTFDLADHGLARIAFSREDAFTDCRAAHPNRLQMPATSGLRCIACRMRTRRLRA